MTQYQPTPPDTSLTIKPTTPGTPEPPTDTPPNKDLTYGQRQDY